MQQKGQYFWTQFNSNKLHTNKQNCNGFKIMSFDFPETINYTEICTQSISGYQELSQLDKSPLILLVKIKYHQI